MRTYHPTAQTRFTCTLLFLSLCSSALAADSSLSAPRPSIPGNIAVQLLLANTLSSAHAHVGDPVDFVVMHDVVVDRRLVVRAGSLAHGSITAVHHRRIFGLGGEVDLKVDSVYAANGERLAAQAQKKVRGRCHFGRIAAEMLATAVFYMPAAPIFLLSRGDDSTVLKSTELTARIAANNSLQLTDLPDSREKSSELAQMLEFLPPRVLTAEGRAADMVNLIFLGESDELQSAFERAGWVKTDRWRPIMAWHLFCRRNHDTQLPMARFYLFGRVQDYSYALPDPDAIVTRRHHLRIWKTRYTVDDKPVWAGAATHDVAIEIAKRGRIINHTIDPEVDAERDFIGSNLDESRLVSRAQYLQATEPVYFANTASGESYYSDSRILLLDLHQVRVAQSSPLAPAQTLAPLQLPSTLAKKAGVSSPASGYYGKSPVAEKPVSSENP